MSDSYNNSPYPLALIGAPSLARALFHAGFRPLHRTTFIGGARAIKEADSDLLRASPDELLPPIVITRSYEPGKEAWLTCQALRRRVLVIQTLNPVTIAPIDGVIDVTSGSLVSDLVEDLGYRYVVDQVALIDTDGGIRGVGDGSVTVSQPTTRRDDIVHDLLEQLARARRPWDAVDLQFSSRYQQLSRAVGRRRADEMRQDWLSAMKAGVITMDDVIRRAAADDSSPLRRITLLQLSREARFDSAATGRLLLVRFADFLEMREKQEAAVPGRNVGWLIDLRTRGRRLGAWAAARDVEREIEPTGFPFTVLDHRA